MAEHKGQQHRLPQIPPVALDNHRRLYHGRLPSRFRRRVLPQHFSVVGIPICHVLRHRCAYWVHNLCLRGHRQRVWTAGVGPGLRGLLSVGLLRLAGEARIRR